MDRDDSIVNWLVAMLTFGSLFPVFLIRLTDFQATIFWVYSICMTGFIILTYLLTNGYSPIPDLGYRPSVSVIIPAKNEEKNIAGVVQAVFASDYPASKIEVIAIDDGSTDRTWDELKKIRDTPELGERLTLIRHARNQGKRPSLASGFRRARGEIIVCIDSDSFVDREAIKFLVQPFSDRDIAGVCGHGEAANREEGFLAKVQHYWYQVMFRIFKGMESRFSSVTCCSGLLAAYRRTCVLGVIEPWLQQRFLGKLMLIGDDRELTNLVLRGSGGKLVKTSDGRVVPIFPLSARESKVVYQSNAIARTIVPRRFRGFLRQQLRWKRSHIHGSFNASKYMWRKSLPAAFAFYLYLFLILMSPIVVIVWLIVRPLQGNHLASLVFVAGNLYVGFLSGLNVWKLSRTSREAIPYAMAFVFLNLFLSLTVLLYGWLTPWKGGWITRAEERVLRVEEETPLLH